MRIDLKEKNHFLTVFEAFFEQSINRPINGISIDSRNIKKNDLFIAIKGENFDGNDFVDQAIQDGASYTLSSYKNESIPSNHHYSLRTKDWRYIIYDSGKEELYHNAVDPKEWNNLVYKKTHPKRDEMVKILKEVKEKIHN